MVSHIIMALNKRLCCLLLLILFSLLPPAWAQEGTNITPDRSLGTMVTPNSDRSIHTIGGGTMRGPNLFHSFERFDVGTDDTASFIGPASVAHILSRVTGGQQSMIDGTLQSGIAGADLYLLNPSGVIFGPNAQLDLQGSFHVSTANVIRLRDGGLFVTHLSAESQLTVATPVAFGFLST